MRRRMKAQKRAQISQSAAPVGSPLAIMPRRRLSDGNGKFRQMRAAAFASAAAFVALRIFASAFCSFFAAACFSTSRGVAEIGR